MKNNLNVKIVWGLLLLASCGGGTSGTGLSNEITTVCGVLTNNGAAQSAANVTVMSSIISDSIVDSNGQFQIDISNASDTSSAIQIIVSSSEPGVEETVVLVDPNNLVGQNVTLGDGSTIAFVECPKTTESVEEAR